MKTKFKLSCLFLAALMLFSLTACGKDNPEPSSTSEGTEQTKPPVEAGSGTTIHTNLWDLTYDEADGWVYEEDDLHDDETSSKIILTLPKEGEDGSIVDAEIRVSVEDPYTFRDYLTSYGFDEYEYAVDQAYDLRNRIPLLALFHGMDILAAVFIQLQDGGNQDRRSQIVFRENLAEALVFKGFCI